MAIGRFQVMAVLQAVRALILGLPEESAKSWGLNRAIFYAAAKHGFKGAPPMTAEYRAARERGELEGIDVFRLGDELAFKEERDGRLYFTIGGKVQSEEDFKRQIQSKFGDFFYEVWDEALKTLSKFDRTTLLSQKRFYGDVYKPLRDELVEKWSELVIKRVAKPRAES